MAIQNKTIKAWLNGRAVWGAPLLGAVALWMGCSIAPSATPIESDDSTNPVQVDVEVVKPIRQNLMRQIVTPASFEAFRKTTVYSKVSGYLEWIRVDIGDRVRKGQVIAQIEIPEMHDDYREAEAQLAVVEADHDNAQAELESAQAEFELKEVTYKRLQAVREEEPDVLPQQTVDEARAEFQVSRAKVKVIESTMNQVLTRVRKVEASLSRLKTLLSYAEVRAPFAGIITERFVHPGALIQEATTSQNVQPIVTVSDMEMLRVFLDIPESEVPFVEVGDMASITVDALPDRKVEGKVTRFATALNPSTRTMKTEIDIPNPERLLRPGMYGRVTLVLEERPETLTIPAQALHVDGKTTFVYAVSAGTAKKTEIQTGLNDGITIEVIQGLEGSETLVVEARGQLDHGTNVNSIQSWAPKE